jgi:membrane protease YdiL (CAAX protease family)
MIRILSLSMPLANLSQTYWHLIVALPVLTGAFTAIRLLSFRPSEVGLSLRQSPLQVLLQGVVALTGIVFGLVEYYILSPEPLVPVLTWQRLLLPGFIHLVATGFTEELVFRGVIQRGSMEVLGRGGLFYTAAVFSVLHIGYLSWMHCGFVFLVGLFFGWVVKRTGSIVGVSLSHGISNIGLYLVFPFVV